MHLMFSSRHSCFQALKEFQLDHEEIIQRRRLLSQCLQQQVNEIVFSYTGFYTYYLIQWENLKKSDSTSRRSSSLDHRRSVSKAHALVKSSLDIHIICAAYTHNNSLQCLFHFPAILATNLGSLIKKYNESIKGINTFIVVSCYSYQLELC